MTRCQLWERRLGRETGRVAAHSADAQARRANTQRRHALAKSAWLPSSLPAWLNEETYLGKIQPLLAGLTNKAVASALGSSIPYASAIRAGRRVPHPRWGIRSKVNAIPLRSRTRFRCDSEQHSGLKVNADSGGKANSFCRLAEWRSAWSGMFSTDEQQEVQRRWTITRH